MPKNTVTDPITGQEIAFAHLVLSGTMTDRRAAEAVGLNPDSAAYTKSKPRVRAYMLEHRAATQQQLVEQEAQELRQKNLWREKVLDRLWEIAKLPAEVTRGSITGQVKAISMIMAIEGLIPSRTMNDRRPSLTQNDPAAPPESRRPEHSPSEATEPGDVVAATKVQAVVARSPEPKSPPHPAPNPANNLSFPNFDPNHSSVFNPFIHPKKPNWVPGDTGSIFNAALDAMNSIRLPFGPK